MRTLIAENTAKRTLNGVYFGYSLYRTDDSFDVVLRNRTYEGGKVSSKWDSTPIKIKATSQQDAVQIARQKVVSHMNSLSGEEN